MSIKKKKNVNRLLREIIIFLYIRRREENILHRSTDIQISSDTGRKQIDSRKIFPIIGSYNAKVSVFTELGTIVRFQFTTGYSSHEAIIFLHTECSGNTLSSPLFPISNLKNVSVKWYRWIKGWFVQWNDFLAPDTTRKRYPRDNVKKKRKKKKERKRKRIPTQPATREIHCSRGNYRGQCRASNAALKFQSIFNYGEILVSRFTAALLFRHENPTRKGT